MKAPKVPLEWQIRPRTPISPLKESESQSPLLPGKSAPNLRVEESLGLNQPPAETLDAPGGNYRWFVIALGFAITLVNYLDRSALSYAIGPLKEQFHLTDADFGLVASAFGVGYMVMTFGGGLIVDRWGAHRIWAGAAVLWSTCTALIGASTGLPMLFGLRTLLGIAEGPHFPALGRVVADWLPASERGRATAVGLTAVPMASVIGAPMLSIIVSDFGWQKMFTILGSLGIVWAVFWLILYRDFPEKSKFVSNSELAFIRGREIPNRDISSDDIRREDHKVSTTSMKFMLLNPSLMANNFAFFSFGYLVFFALTWLPGYFQETYHLVLKREYMFLMAPWLTAAVLMPIAGWISDYLWKTTGSIRMARSHMIWICQLLSALCFIPLLFTHSLTTSTISISLGIGLGMMPNAAFYAINCDLAKDRAATSLGIMDCFFALAGIISPYLTGKLATMTGSFTAGFGLLIFFSLVSVVAVAFFQKDEIPVPSTN